MPHTTSVVVALVLGAALSAQATPFTITSTCTPNCVFSVTSYPTSTTSPGGLHDLRCGGPDQLFQAWWYYRLNTDTREYAFHNGATSGLRPQVIDGKGDRAVLTWRNCDGRGFDAELTYQVYSTSPASGVLSQCMKITNNTGAPLTLNLYDYCDFDVCGATLNSATFVGPPRQCEVTAATCLTKSYHLACAPTRYQTGAFSTVRSLLFDAVPTTLSNAGIPFGPGDWTNAHQWEDVVIPIGQSATFYSALSCDQPIPCCSAADVRNYCVAKPGTNGLPAWGGNRLYTCGTNELKVRNGRAGSAPIVVVGLPPDVCIPVGGIGSLAVLPILASFAMPAFDAANASAVCVSIPCAPSFCGARLHLQAFFADPGAAGGIAHTDGSAFTIGSL